MKFLHFITKPYSIGILEPLIKEIEINNAGENRIYISKNNIRFLKNKRPYMTTITEAIDYNPDILFAPGNVVHHNIPGIKVQVFHGLCEEKKGHYKINGLFDLYCTSGPLVTKKFQKLADKYKYFSVEETGWIKIDKLLKNYNKTKICNKLEIPLDKKIILYTPTFSPRFKSSEKILPYIHAIPKKDEFWLIKFHDLMNPKDIEKFSTLPPEKFKINKNPDNTEILQIADVLISDTSSIVYEFMILDKPVITIDSKIRTDKGINITKISELRKAIDRSITNPQEYSLKRKKYLAQIHPYNDQKNAHRVLKASIDFYQKTPLESMKPKPLNLWRKYKLNKIFYR